MPNSRPRLKSFDYTGFYRYFLTFCTADRHEAFRTREVVDPVLSQILRAAGDEGFAVVAYCFMPDHVHLLVEGQAENSHMPAFVRRAKQFSGFWYKQRTGHRLWQPSYFDHVLREEDDTMGVARYIVENPLIERLVERLDDYPFWGSATVGRKELLDAVRWTKPWR